MAHFVMVILNEISDHSPLFYVAILEIEINLQTSFVGRVCVYVMEFWQTNCLKLIDSFRLTNARLRSTIIKLALSRALGVNI